MDYVVNTSASGNIILEMCMRAKLIAAQSDH